MVSLSEDTIVGEKADDPLKYGDLDVALVKFFEDSHSLLHFLIILP